MIKLFITSLLCFVVVSSIAQVVNDQLFSSQEPLDIAISMSVRTIKNEKFDTVYFPEKLYYNNLAGTRDSITVGVKRRGNFRLENCMFPPLWIKINKKQAANTLFEGNKKIKLVMPCDSRELSNQLILREYLCYRLYEVITSDCFQSRLVNISFTEERGKKSKTFQLKGIFVEDVAKTAARISGKVSKHPKVIPSALNDTCTLRFDLFQLLIANTDWSKGSQHNSKLVYRNTRYVPLPYDFDMSGVVDAPYAVVSRVGDNQLPIETVTERYYRGFCASSETTELVRNEFLAKEQQLLAVPDELKGSLSNYEIERLKSYLKEFFEILKSDNDFKREVVNRCRPK